MTPENPAPKRQNEDIQKNLEIATPLERSKFTEKEEAREQKEETEILDEIIANSDFSTYKKIGKSIQFHTGNRFADRFDQFERVKTKMRGTPNLIVAVKDGKIAEVSCPMKEQNSDIRDMADSFVGEKISNAALIEIGDAMYAAHIMCFWDELKPFDEKPELKTWRVQPLGNEQEEKKWISAVRDAAEELEKESKIPVEKNPPAEHIDAIPEGKTELPDGTIIEIKKTDASHAQCTITRPDETTEVWLYTGSVNSELSKLTLLSDAKKRKAITAVESKSLFIIRDTTFWENLLGKEVPESEMQFNAQLLADETLRAINERKGEMQDAANVNAFDLPKDEAIGFIAMADTQDKVMKGAKETMRMMPRLLAKQGYQMYCSPGAEWIDPSETKKGAADVLKEKIREYQKKGIRTVYVTLPAHGSEDGLHYGKVSEPETKQVKSKAVLSPAEIVNVLNAFPDMQIIVETLACYGGHFEETAGDLEYTENGRQKVMFLQTKKQTVNLINNSLHQSMYSTILIDSLAKGMRYGEAHRHADEVAKRLSGINAEMFRTGRSGTKKTAQNTGQKDKKPMDS